MRNTADVTGGEPISLSATSGVSADTYKDWSPDEESCCLTFAIAYRAHSCANSHKSTFKRYLAIEKRSLNFHCISKMHLVSLQTSLYNRCEVKTREWKHEYVNVLENVS
jgi:hypothetical protein